MTDRVTVGSFEVVSLPDLGLHDIVAKVDTGAYSGAIHCTNITIEDGMLFCCPAGESESTYQTDTFIVRKVRSSNGQQIERYLIVTTVIIKGVSYEVEIGLSDRTTMKRQVLIGRRFLRDHNMLVDVCQNAQYDADRKATL